MIRLTSKRKNKKNPSVSSRVGVNLGYKNKVRTKMIKQTSNIVGGI